ncbi:hypothetical protein ACFPZ0_10130 [Streptomonospora nanhaiensis]|uniref:Lipoprotein n=1 Tax=Streptomonospora nanhaiensis TaxID=1323731 RepID=A0A853BTX0_9ACTN|nr:hypothetical protein [Streptomonospora nanhaiensis]MBV2362710.1 hypothetical protein [Streptomonospora nanhaiensis]MBX9389168.1 hypothetical protein [Streptomonospora nanhaiensis]NYI97941.1 hypothetical protein [Streptomonospora nanhaiensis]
MPLRRVLLPFALAGCLALSACGSEPGPTMEELETMIAPSSGSSGPAADPSALAELRFNAESMACEPRLSGNAPGAWETSAPRAKAEQGAEIGVRDTEGDGEVPVTARVTAPDDQAYEATATASGTEWARITFPGDFPEPPESAPGGVYTVVWTTDDGAFIACDGFRLK